MLINPPAHLFESTVVFLPKPKGNGSFDSLRPIEVENTFLKIINRIANNRLQAQLKHIVGDTQFGFIKGRDTTTAIKLTDKKLKEGYSLIALDFARAYTNTNTNKLAHLPKTLGNTGKGEA